MNSIISYLLLYNQFLISTIHQLVLFIVKNIPLKDFKDNHFSPKYQKFSVDALPIIKKPIKLDYKAMLSEYQAINGKELKPVRRRGVNTVPQDSICPRCGAPHDYLYDNDGGRGQLLCKICDFRFNKDKKDFSSNTLICPYCGHALAKKKSRKFFNIHKCVNIKCPFYLDSLGKLSSEELKEFKEAKYKFKLHYIYREFTIDFFKVDLSSMPKGSFSFNFRKFSPHVMGLCLTYHVNLGLSTRATARPYGRFMVLRFPMLWLANMLKLLLQLLNHLSMTLITSLQIILQLIKLMLRSKALPIMFGLSWMLLKSLF